MKKIFYISLGLLIFTFSCDKVDAPYIEKHEGGGGDTTVVVQKVLVEDFTAHYCVNCPRAAEQIEQLEDAYGSKIIPLAIHVTSLAQPNPNPPGNPYDIDFRTTIGNDLEQEFSVLGLPSGMISRTEYAGSILVGDGNWPSAVSVILDNEPLIGLQLEPAIDTVSKKLSLDIAITPQQDINTTDKVLKVCAYITESHIFGAQKDETEASGEIINYEFNHVLRASFNGTWGERVSNDDLIQNGTINKSYTDLDIDANWDFHNLGAVVFVYDSLTNEVVQAENIEF